MPKFNIGQWSKEEAGRREERRIERERLDTLPLRLYGQKMDDLYSETPEIMVLSEVAIVGSPAVLRDLAKHLLESADALDRAIARDAETGSDVVECGWHEHWRMSAPDVIVCGPRPEDEENLRPITKDEQVAEWKRRGE